MTSPLVPVPPNQVLMGQRTVLYTMTAYRIAIALLLLLLFNIKLEERLLGAVYPALYLASIVIYLGIHSLAAYLAFSGKLRTSTNLLFLGFFTDIATLVALQIASNEWGQPLSLIYLLVVVISGLSLPRRIALLVTALASLALLTPIVRQVIQNDAQLDSLSTNATFAIVFFITFFIVQRFSVRTLLYENLVSRQASSIVELQHLNEMIVQRMRAGILLLDHNNKILLSNLAARTALGKISDESFRELSPILIQELKLWRDNPLREREALKLKPDGPQIAVNFAILGNPGDDEKILVFIEDIRPLAQQAQNMKLASMGNLTASIAHEIRNPLGAISHAAQLLEESGPLAAKQQRLSTIIQTNSMRMNQIVENVLALSSQKLPDLQLLELAPCVHDFVHTFVGSHGEHNIQVLVSEENILAYTDRSQLQQILNGLLENAVKHGSVKGVPPQIKLRIRRVPPTGLPAIEIADSGPGVASEHISHIFEPFYTTSHHGTGLGLFVCRELCQANQIDIAYVPGDSEQRCFRLSFGHPNRRPLPTLGD